MADTSTLFPSYDLREVKMQQVLTIHAVHLVHVRTLHDMHIWHHFVHNYLPSAGLMEIARRKKALETMGEKYPLYPLAVDCLHDNPTRRPTAEELNKRLADLCTHEYPKTFADILDVTAEVLVLLIRN